MSAVIVSRVLNPYLNLSLGTYLTTQAGKTLPEKMLLLCSSHHGVFIGRNQNCWQECNMQKMREAKVPLVRRDTGGGACYVDRGNRLFSFIEVNKNPKIDKYYPILLEALNNLRLNGQIATMRGRNDIIIGQKKVSGSAFTFDGQVFRHHGTLLHSVDTSKLGTYLTPSKVKLQSKGVSSVDQRICNLADLVPDLTMEELDSAIIAAYRKQSPDFGQVVEITDLNNHGFITDRVLFQQIFDRYTSEDFLYNNNPSFTHKFTHKFSFGIVDLLLSCSENKISACEVYSDSLKLRLIESIKAAMVSKDYSFEGVEEIRKAMLGILGAEYQEEIDEFCSYLHHEFFK